MRIYFTLNILLLLIPACSQLKAQVPVINLVNFSTGYTSPVDIKNCGDSRLFIVQQNGYVFICDSDGVKNSIPFLDIHSEIIVSSERGLLGIAFHPDYFNNGYFYVYYTSADSGKITISRFSVDPLNPDLADPNSEMVLIQIKHFDYSNHNGGCLRFGPDGYLYAGTGDGGSGGDPANNAQNPKSRLGKLLRLDVNSALPYAIPPDNPFVNDSDWYPEIYAYGLRNPWRYSFDRLTNDLWIGDVGQDSLEEVDYIASDTGGGQNYGWRCYEGNLTYNTSLCGGITNFTFPVYEYPHTNGADPDCSETGGFVYRGGQYGNMYGKYFLADYCSGLIRDLEADGGGGWTANVVGNFGNNNFSSFGEDRYGELYLSGVGDGKIYRVTDIECKPAAVILVNAPNGLIIDSTVCGLFELQAVYGQGLSYQWQKSGMDIPGATSLTYLPSDTGTYSVLVMNTDSCINTSSVVKMGYPTLSSFAGLESFYCQYELPDSLTGNPSGGVFEGSGISGNTFNPFAAGAGSHDITYTYTNSYGCITSETQTTLVDACTGINMVWEQYGMNIFPVPNNGVFTIMLKDAGENISELSMLNLSGQTVMQFTLPSAQSNIFTLNASLLQNGVYFLKMLKGGQLIYQKIVIGSQR